jgi:hypothetical protein
MARRSVLEGRLRDAVVPSRLVTREKLPVDIPVLALTVAEAARSVGLSESVFRREVLSQVRSVQVGRRRVVAVVELERWLYLNGRIADDE